jgi:predicted MFS family arabinose efflux permease
MIDTALPAARLATRLAFFVAGFGIACWAPLVPFAKARLAVNDAELGILLLCIGIGAVLSMVAVGPVSARYGCRPVIIVGGYAMAAILPLLSLSPTPVTLGLALLGFGAALGALDVAMNVHAVEVERAEGRPVMSGFHAMFSIGGFFGATLVAGLLTLQVPAWAGTIACGILMGAATFVAAPRLLTTSASKGGPLFALPRGVVALLAALAAVTFLVEGAMLDWSALLIAGNGLLPVDQAGFGYAVFAIAMTCGRLTGDAVVERMGDRWTLTVGGIVAVAGFVLLLASPWVVPALVGFALIGLGAANVVPVYFRRAGTQQAMPPALAVTAITATGYAGHLLGPALIGFASNLVGLAMCFWAMALLMCLVPLTTRAVTGGQP